VTLVDNSALMKRYVPEPGSEVVAHLMRSDPEWSASAICAVETRIGLCRLELAEEKEAAFAADWELFDSLPVDDDCLARAAEIGCDHGVRTLDAIHLAAAERIPPPLSFLTFDDRQREAAEALGFTLVG